MPSFDIVSEVENQEARNAVDNANREVETRFDFRGVEASFEWKDDATVVKADGDFHLEQMIDILRAKIVKRGIDPQTMDIGNWIIPVRHIKELWVLRMVSKQTSPKKSLK